MDVNLIYQKTGYSFQISKFTPLSFIYEVSNKVFHIPTENIKLFFKDQFVPNDHSYATNYFKKFPVIINIMEIKKSKQVNNEKSKENQEKIFNETFSDKGKQKKKNFIKCQICSRKNSLFYCRNCNQFICFECNLRYPEHFGHNKISLESGDLLLCFEEYRNNVLEQLNELNNAFRFSSENLYSEKKRVEIFDYLITTLKDLDKKTQSLSIMGTSYKCDNEVLLNFNKELREIEAPKYKEETVNSFGLVNEKELEIQNYIRFVNLQILKSKFNKKMIIFFNEAKKIFNDLMIEINNKLHDLIYLKQKDYNDLVIYNKEKYKEINCSSESSSSYSSKSGSNKSSLIYSSNNKNSNEIFNNDVNNNENYINKTDNNKVSNNQNDEFLRIKNNIINKRRNGKYKSTSNIQNKIDLNNILNSQKKEYNSKINNIDNINVYNSHRSYNNKYINNNDNNINKINGEITSIKDDTIPINEFTIEGNLTLPKIRITNPSYSTIHKKLDKKTLFSPIMKNKKNMINIKNINKNILKQSIQNILKESNSKNISTPKGLKSFNKIIDDENQKTIKVDKQKNIIISQRCNTNSINNINNNNINDNNDNNNIIYSYNNINNKNINNNNYNDNISKKSLSNLKINLTHENEKQRIKEENKKHCITISNESTTKSLEKIAMNKFINNLKKIKPNYKIKLYDSYKSKEKEEENIEDIDINKSSKNPIVIALKKKKRTKTKFFQKEKK